VAASFRLLMMEHAGRVLFQEKTRRELGGPFFADYRRSVRWPSSWGDGDSWFVNYYGHPMHGGAAGFTWLARLPDQDREFENSRRYWTTRFGAVAWMAAYSLQFEIGPLSEASIGNVGLRPHTVGWVDHVITPVGGLAIIVADEVLDKYVVTAIERRTSNPFLRAVVRIALNPTRTLANIADLRTPWYRVRGPLRYDARSAGVLTPARGLPRQPASTAAVSGVVHSD
jgi:hypothetical protein